MEVTFILCISVITAKKSFRKVMFISCRMNTHEHQTFVLYRPTVDLFFCIDCYPSFNLFSIFQNCNSTSFIICKGIQLIVIGSTCSFQTIFMNSMIYGTSIYLSPFFTSIFKFYPPCANFSLSHEFRNLRIQLKKLNIRTRRTKLLNETHINKPSRKNTISLTFMAYVTFLIVYKIKALNTK